MKTQWKSLIPIALSFITSAHCIGDEALAKDSECLECHNNSETNIGPTFETIASKYQGDPSARAKLIKVMQNGGKGNWTEISRGVPMPPYSPRLTDAEIEQLVDWVLNH